MKKVILLLALLVPGIASAGTELTCQAQGDFLPITMTFTSADSMLSEGAMVHVESQGVMSLSFDMVAEPLFSSFIEQNIRLRQIDAATGELLEGGIEALVSLGAYEDRVDGDIVAVLTGEGSVRLLKAPAGNVPRFQPLYTLTECAGTL